MKGGICISLKNIAIIDTDVLIKNFNAIKSVLKEGVKICSVVKADAYGHGAVGISRILEPYTDYFAVALVEEGRELRLSGITKPILILLPTDGEGAEIAMRYGMELTVDGYNSLKTVCDVAVANNTVARIHIKLDTGMHRFGLNANEIDLFCRDVSTIKEVCVSGVYSHFYNSQRQSDLLKQYYLFKECVEKVKSFFKDIIVHLSASGGILQGKNYNFDMVRPGLLLYGYKPYESNFLDVEPILSIKAKSLKQNVVLKGEHLLYGDHVLAENTLVNVVRVGYADGLRRHDAGILNARCMDVSALRHCGDDDWVTVFDGAEKNAVLSNTITYEILCGITRRSNIIYKE